MLRQFTILFTLLFHLSSTNSQCNIPGLDVPLSFEPVSFPLQHSVCLGVYEIYFYALLMQAQSKNQDKDICTKLSEFAGIWAAKQLLGLISVIMHELGHAVTSKGSTFYTLKNIEIHYDLISLLTGAYAGKTYSTYSLESEKLSRFHVEKILHCIAGPVAGIASIYCIYKYLVPDFIKKSLMEYRTNGTPLIAHFLLSVLGPHIMSSLPSMDLHSSADPTDFDQAYDSFNVLLQRM